jgi:hypothetical protein
MKLTQIEWTDKIYKELYRKNGSIPSENNKTWWVSSQNLRLTKLGLQRFEEAGITIYSIPYESPKMTLGSRLGLSRIPSPFYYDSEKFCFTDDQSTILFKLLDCDLNTFAREFTRDD